MKRLHVTWRHTPRAERKNNSDVVEWRHSASWRDRNRSWDKGMMGNNRQIQTDTGRDRDRATDVMFSMQVRRYKHASWCVAMDTAAVALRHRGQRSTSDIAHRSYTAQCLWAILARGFDLETSLTKRLLGVPCASGTPTASVLSVCLSVSTRQSYRKWSHLELCIVTIVHRQNGRTGSSTWPVSYCTVDSYLRWPQGYFKVVQMMSS